MQKGQDVVRLRHYVCPHCGTEVGNHEVAMKRLNDWLEGESDDGKKAVKQIVFEGERFDVMSVRRWREEALGRRLT